LIDPIEDQPISRIGPAPNLLYAGSRAVRNNEVLGFLDSQFKKMSLSEALWNPRLSADFLHRYVTWIGESKLNQFSGFAEFPHLNQTNGLTQILDCFYLRHAGARFRCFRGEYLYNLLSWRNTGKSWCFLDDEPVTSGDAVVISLPFSDSGGIHPQTQLILNQCNELAIPVLIDCAYFGVCQGLQFNFNQPSIESIGFSLSKSFPVAYGRIGMRLSRKNSDDPISVLQSMDYVNRPFAQIGLELLNHFDPDYNCRTYSGNQFALCQKLGVEPSSCVLFGLGDSTNWSHLNRGGSWNRLCFSDQLSIL
jgi:hypothetical protein